MARNKKEKPEPKKQKPISANVEGVRQRISPGGNYEITITLKAEGKEVAEILKSKFGEKIKLDL